MFIEIHRPLPPVDLRNVERNLFFHVESGSEVNNRVLCTLNSSVQIRGDSFRTLGPAQHVDADMMNGVCELFRKRDYQIKQSYDEVNSGHRTFRTYKPSIFCHPQFLRNLLRDPQHQTLQNHNQSLSNVYRIYCPVETNDGLKLSWSMLVLDIHRKCFYFFDPATHSDLVALSLHQHSTDTESNMNYITYSRTQIVDALNVFLEAQMSEDRGGRWNFATVNFPVQYETNEDDFTAGIYIMTIVYYLVCELPIMFSRTDAMTLRRKWAHWVLLETLS